MGEIRPPSRQARPRFQSYAHPLYTQNITINQDRYFIRSHNLASSSPAETAIRGTNSPGCASQRGPLLRPARLSAPPPPSSFAPTRWLPAPRQKSRPEARLFVSLPLGADREIRLGISEAGMATPPPPSGPPRHATNVVTTSRATLLGNAAKVGTEAPLQLLPFFCNPRSKGGGGGGLRGE